MFHVTYRINNRKPFMVLPGDAEWMSTIKDFEVVTEPKAPVVTDPTPETAIVADPIAEEPTLTPVDSLDIRPEVVSVLEENFDSVEEIKQTSDTAILAIKGIGPSRLKDIREAVEKLNA